MSVYACVHVLHYHYYYYYYWHYYFLYLHCPYSICSKSHREPRWGNRNEDDL